MARGASSKNHDAHSTSAGSSEPRGSKRRCVQAACAPCRKRKSKCDGGTPVCATCTAVYKTECFYDAESENKRPKTTTATAASAATTVTPFPKRENPDASAPSSNDNAEFIIASLRSLPESEAHEIIQHIRRDVHLDLAALAESLRRTVTLPPSAQSEPQSLETDLSVLLGKPAATQTGESRHFGHTSSLGLVAEDENYTRSRMRSPSVERKPRTWTTVTQDVAFVERLLDLYFRWSHPFYVIFSRECFYKDFRSGRDKYCSPLLVNAILAYACHFTDDPHGRTEPDNFRTAGDHFFAEARRLLHEDETPSLTTTQALCVMAMREPSAGRDSSGFMYIGRCMRMAVELGLHLNYTSAPGMRLTPSEIEVRNVTFWGCFTVDTVWSICIGRISQLPRAAITLDKPVMVEPPSLHPGGYSSSHHHHITPGVLTSRLFLHEFSTLSELVNDNNYMFFAPKERFTSRRLLDCYYKYKSWYKNMPDQLRLDGMPNPQPHIIALHMLYHTVIVHLFRPLLKVDLIHSNVRPRDICIESANQVTELLRLYRSHNDMRAGPLIFTHILLSVSIVHLLYSRNYATSKCNLIDSMQALDELHICHYFGGRGFKIVYALAKRWNLPWPDELKNSKLIPQEGPASPLAESLVVPQTTSIASRMGGGAGYSPLPPSTQPARRESLGMFTSEQNNISLPSHVANNRSGTMGKNAPHQQQNIPLSAYPPPASAASTIPTTSATPSSDSAETLFWTPVPGGMPGMGVPILPRNYQLSPMDLNTMLGNVDEWDRFGRDGFKMSETWPQDPMNSFNNGQNGRDESYGPNQSGVEYQGAEPSTEFENNGQQGGGYDGWWVAGASGGDVG